MYVHGFWKATIHLWPQMEMKCSDKKSFHGCHQQKCACIYTYSWSLWNKAQVSLLVFKHNALHSPFHSNWETNGYKHNTIFQVKRMGFFSHMCSGLVLNHTEPLYHNKTWQKLLLSGNSRHQSGLNIWFKFSVNSSEKNQQLLYSFIVFPLCPWYKL